MMKPILIGALALALLLASGAALAQHDAGGRPCRPM